MSAVGFATDVLLVEDDTKLAELTSRYLEQNGLKTVVESRGDTAVRRFREARPRIVLLDLMLPGQDGLSVCRELRTMFSGPILIFTAKDADIDQVVGLSAGADDYVTKPADPMVLLARIRALLRRSEAAATPASQQDIVLGTLRIIPSSQEVWLDHRVVQLSTQEFELLTVLARHAGTVLTRDELLRETRGIDYDGFDRSIDVRISKLRKKLNDDGLAPRRIKTVWGRGYLLVPDSW